VFGVRTTRLRLKVFALLRFGVPFQATSTLFDAAARRAGQLPYIVDEVRRSATAIPSSPPRRKDRLTIDDALTARSATPII